MKLHMPGKIFLADQRGLKETEQLKRYSTFNFEGFNHPDKTAVDHLYALNDDFLAGGQQTTFEIEKDSYLIILPITGAVNYLDDAENETDIDVEEAVVVFVAKGTNIILSNPFDHDVVNYLCFFLDDAILAPNNPQFFNFDLNNQNKLIKIKSNSLPFTINIGRFEGRKDAVYVLQKDAKIFAFVITGAFEFDGRLLHQKDGLALWDNPQIELEALSNNAVVVILEMHSNWLIS